MKRKQLFLRWAVINMVVAPLLGILGMLYVSKIHSAPLIVTLIILAITIAASLYCGRLAWMADDVLERGKCDELKKIKHAIEHIHLAAYTCQVLAMLGAAFGVYFVTSVGADSAASAAKDITQAMANGLLATISGVLCSLLLLLQAHCIKHPIEGVMQ